MQKILIFCILYSQVTSSPSQRNPIAPSDWGDPSHSIPHEDEPMSREELLKSYLFSSTQDGNIHVEDFLWTGSGDSDLPLEDFDITSSMVDGISNPDDSNFINYLPTTLTVTRVSTVVSTIHHPHYSHQGGQSEQGNDLDKIDPTPTYPMAGNTYASHIGFQNHSLSSSNEKLPNEKYLVRTVVLSNMTVIRRDIEKFKKDMEIKLERAFRKAYARKRKRMKRNEDFHLVRRVRQVSSDPDNESSFQRTRIKIHNIRSSLPEPEIEMLYTVYEDDKPVLAQTAVETLLDNVDDEDAEEYLGFPLITKAEPYIQRLKVDPNSTLAHGSSSWMIASIILCLLFLLALLLLLLLLTWNRCKDDNEHAAKHKRLVSSPLTSQASTLKDRRKTQLKQSSSSLEKAGFNLSRPKSKASIVRVSDNENEFDFDERPKSPSVKSSPPTSIKQQAGAIETAYIERAPQTTYDDCATSTGSLNIKVDRAESPILADLSSNETPEMKQRNRRPKHLIKKHKSKRVSPVDRNSAFPSSTPDRAGWLGPLSDLLEEDGDEEDGSHSPGRNSNSSNLSSSTTTTTSSSSLKVGWRKEKRTKSKEKQSVTVYSQEDISAPQRVGAAPDTNQRETMRTRLALSVLNRTFFEKEKLNQD
ncbi:uncharacterized protein [Lepeophtheirus salmonis]|uniref:uncharacterized protein isoform X2 n=1 Tax=Lepeophtheirus salmonis TaxID=72036 RepID=UPI001AE63FD7|nr:uncharacterized protein LOC121120607 isoform X2 [Lepeophtheirus salmonis]